MKRTLPPPAALRPAVTAGRSWKPMIGEGMAGLPAVPRGGKRLPKEGAPCTPDGFFHSPGGRCAAPFGGLKRHIRKFGTKLGELAGAAHRTVRMGERRRRNGI